MWENASNRTPSSTPRTQKILKSTDGHPPSIYDPFCGGGSIPLEAQRLGLDCAYGSDLNPVAVLINKALIEIPATFAGNAPVNPKARNKMTGKGMWTGARGLADDVRYYGQWMRDRAFERIGHLYPTVNLPQEDGGDHVTVIAWLWTRTVLCPNPACGARMPLMRSFALSTKPGKNVWAEPVIDHASKSVRFEVKNGFTVPEASEGGTKQRNGSRCLFCSNVMNDAQVRAAATAHGFGELPVAVIAEGARGRIYLSAERCEQPTVPDIPTPWLEQPLPSNPRWFSTPGYGLPNFRDLFTRRQLVALTTFSDLIAEARKESLQEGASIEYADAIATYLAFAVDKAADRNSSLCTLERKMNRLTNTFSRQALPMVWDFAETNPFAEASGDLRGAVESVSEVLDKLVPGTVGAVRQLDATASNPHVTLPVFCTDPPYYDNIGYADLSDFFYVWLRRNLSAIYPDLFSTLLVPKTRELVATPYRFGGSKKRAQEFFEEGFGRAFQRMSSEQHPDFPMPVFYRCLLNNPSRTGKKKTEAVGSSFDGVGDHARRTNQRKPKNYRYLARSHGTDYGSEGEHRRARFIRRSCV